MFKKISVFIMILGLFFVGIPQYNVKAQGYDQGYDEGWDNGYNAGQQEGYDEGWDNGYNAGELDGFIAGFDEGFLQGETAGYMSGYYAGLNETDATGFTALLTTIFGGLGALLGIEILPGIYIGAIIAVPLVFGIIFFILGKKKGE